MTLLLTFGLLGIGAVAVDVGSWYGEKAQLQNGSDGAALAVAQACAANPSDVTACTSSTSNSTAVRYANNNANDGASSVSFICGNAPNATGTNRLTPCGSNNGLCKAGSGNYVSIQLGSDSPLPSLLGRFIPGNGGSGENIYTCSQVSFGNASGGNGISLTFSYCNWKAATANGTVFAPAPPYAVYPPPGVAPYTGTVPAAGVPGGEQVLQIHGTGNDCVGGPGGSGYQLPGGFGYLAPDGNNGPCSTLVSPTGTYVDQTGVSISDSCATVLDADRTNHTVIYLPIFDGLTGTGSNGTYHLAGFAAFVVTGGFLNGQSGGFKQKSNISNQNYCNGSQRCLYGYFTQGLVPDGITGGGLPGATTAYLTG